MAKGKQMNCIGLDCNPATSLKLVNDTLRTSSDRLESEGFDRFLETIVRQAVEIGGASAGWLAMRSADETQLEVAGLLKRNMQRGGGLVPVQSADRVIPLDGFVSEVWEATKKAEEFHWQQLDERRSPVVMRGWYERRRYREALLVPIRLGGTTFGQLPLIFGPQGRPSHARLHVVRVLAQQAALAIRMQHLGHSASEAARRSAIEAERSRMAGEIHDGLAQAFLSVIMQARAARLGGRLRTQRLLQSIEEIESLAVGGLEEARRSVFALRSIFVESAGLVPALERLVDSLSIAGRTRFAFENRAGAPHVSAVVEDCAYRIVQEATQNALKHAGAQLVTVRLERDGGWLRVRVEDDGDNVVHDVIQGARERGGLRAMRERAEGCGGSFLVEPRLPHGTRVDVLLPLKETPA
ncbi:GAF domain-containing sensor histidine kinase [Variovorax sp. J22R133]|uniref:GAF domain-containing sensor histidine kinase n=1 Tax=Variovorax brevis TaxID=3053503 RepID=UPI0025789EA9|nr:GAF domain-containing sensor histidine kinase [Variovorax sp. J22R133]MDM0112322.1 GAF domain-containing sensor histidine kinase [Variovorax sp. J22R133]